MIELKVMLLYEQLYWYACKQVNNEPAFQVDDGYFRDFSDDIIVNVNDLNEEVNHNFCDEDNLSGCEDYKQYLMVFWQLIKVLYLVNAKAKLLFHQQHNKAGADD